MLEKIKNNLNFNNFVLLVASVIAMVLIVDTITVINRNISLSQEAAKISAENKIQETANENKRLNIEYLKSDEFLDLAVRDKLGLGAPGDKLLVFTNLPEPAKKQIQVDQDSQSRLPFWQQNPRDWYDFLLGRQRADVDSIK